jgi:thiamine biosynthesis protein ThiS
LKPYSLPPSGGRCGYGFFISVKIKINGEEKDVADRLSIDALLEHLQIRPGRVVVERNREIVSREAYGSTTLSEGDALEIVHFVGGG